MIGYKLFRKRSDGTYGPLFINKKLKMVENVVYHAEEHPTKGYTYRPGWHICRTPNAPHLSTKGRVWCIVEFEHKQTLNRPEYQGGIWYLGNTLKIISEYTN